MVVDWERRWTVSRTAGSTAHTHAAVQYVDLIMRARWAALTHAVSAHRQTVLEVEK